MSIIQTIQEKYAKVMAVIIALALIIFVVMLAFENGGGLFSGSNNIGEVNGTNITSENFSRKVQAYERNAQQQQQGGGEMATAQAVEQAWNDGVDSLVMAAEYKKLGLTVTDREINAVIFSDNAPQEFKQIFTDPQSGVFDANLARQQFNNVKKQGSADQKNYLNAIVDFVERQMLMSKYTALLTNTIHFPKWMLEKRNVDNSLAAKVSFVGVPYVTIADSTIKISDAEINDYIKAHEKDFQQKQESRSINYVSFSAAPNGADSNAMRNAMLELKKQFDTVTNYQSFVARNSTMPLYEGYVAASAIQQQSKDSILAAGLGNIYGPYLDAGQQGAQMVMSKIFGVTQTPDTVTVRHILVATHQQGQDGQLTQVRDDSSAKKLIDSLQGAIAAGTSFDTIVVKFSDDPGSKEKGGKYEDVTTGKMTPVFNDFIFTHSPGQKGVVKTEFGYHYIEVLSTKGSSTAYKIAYVAKPILASQETENTAQNAASIFAGDSQDGKAFNENWEKNLKSKGVNKLTATDITPMSYNIQGVNGASRKLVKDIFEAEKGDVVGPERVGDAFVVATVTEINKAGIAGVSLARTQVEPILRNKKKAEQIKKNIGTITTLEAVAQKTNQQVSAADSLRFTTGSSQLGYEPKVVGAVFNAALKGKVAPEAIAGQSGVYVIRVDNTFTLAVPAASIDEQRKQMVQQTRQQLMSQMQYGGGNPFVEPLKKAAKIEDNRAKFW